MVIHDKKYRGNIVFRPNDDETVTVIDEMGIEEYLYGVLPKEMSPTWPVEALKSQAVVARTFALNNLGKYSASGYDFSDMAAAITWRSVSTRSRPACLAA